MFSVGTDLIEIDRVKKAAENSRFITKVYGKDEIEELKEKKFAAQSLAASFAAKEAFSKAIGTGIKGFALNEVQLLHNDQGAPFFSFSGKAESLVKKLALNFSVSLTHTSTLAGAIVVAYKHSVSNQ